MLSRVYKQTSTIIGGNRFTTPTTSLSHSGTEKRLYWSVAACVASLNLLMGFRDVPLNVLSKSRPQASLESFDSCCFCIPAKNSFQHFPVFSYACNWDVMFATAPTSLSYHSLFLPPFNLGRKNQKRQICDTNFDDYRTMDEHIIPYMPPQSTTCFSPY